MSGYNLVAAGVPVACRVIPPSCEQIVERSVRLDFLARPLMFPPFCGFFVNRRRIFIFVLASSKVF